MPLLGYGSLWKGLELGFFLGSRRTRNSSGMVCPFFMARFMCRFTCLLRDDGSVHENGQTPSALSGQDQVQTWSLVCVL